MSDTGLNPYTKRNIVSHTDFKDIFGRLGKKILAKGQMEKLYTVCDLAIHSKLNVTVVNTSLTETASVNIYVSDQATPGIIDLVSYAIELEPGATFIRTGLILSMGESVFVISDVDNTVVRVDGFEDRSF